MVHLSLVNIHPEEDLDMTLDIRGMEYADVSARILTSEQISDHNTFENPEVVHPATHKDVKTGKEGITLCLPARSVLVLEIRN